VKLCRCCSYTSALASAGARAWPPAVSWEHSHITLARQHSRQSETYGTKKGRAAGSKMWHWRPSAALTAHACRTGAASAMLCTVLACAAVSRGSCHAGYCSSQRCHSRSGGRRNAASSSLSWSAAAGSHSSRCEGRSGGGRAPIARNGSVWRAITVLASQRARYASGHATTLHANCQQEHALRASAAASLNNHQERPLHSDHGGV
jgi:hypothetical protein